MEDLLKNLNQALHRAWDKYQLPQHPGVDEVDQLVVQELAEVVDARLEAFHKELLRDASGLKSILISRLEEVLFGRDLRNRPFQMFLIPKAQETLDFARVQGSGQGWRLQPKVDPVTKKEACLAVFRVAPPGTELVVGEKTSGIAVSSVKVRLSLDPLAERTYRMTMLLPAPRGWSETSGVPVLAEARGDDTPLALPTVFGAERGQWRHSGAPIRLRWWTEPEGVPPGGGALGPSEVDDSREEEDRSWLLWLGKHQGVGTFLANLLEAEIDVAALRRLPGYRNAHRMELSFRFPGSLGASHVFLDHARVSMEVSQLSPRYQQLQSPRFSEYGKPQHWQLETEGAALALEDILLTVPAHEPGDANVVPSSRLVRPEQRRNLLRAAVRPRANLVTAEDVADAVDDLLAGVGYVHRSGIRGVPTWLEEYLPLKFEEPGLDDFAGFVWIVPVVAYEDAGERFERQTQSAASLLNRRVPIGCRIVMQTTSG